MTYIISLEVDNTQLGKNSIPKTFVYGGNNQGEVYIYEVTNIDEAYQVMDDAPPSAKL